MFWLAKSCLFFFILKDLEQEESVYPNTYFKGVK